MCKNVRHAILNSSEKENAWRFQGTLLEYSDTDIPCELFSFIWWIIQGAQAATTLSRAEELRKKCAIISQTLVRERKSQRQVTLLAKVENTSFRQMHETPYAIGMTLYMYHNFRSQQAVTMRHKMLSWNFL